MTPTLVITGLVPVIPIRMARRFSYRDGRDKPGHDVVGPTPAVIPGEPKAREGDRLQNRAPSSPCGEGWGSQGQSSAYGEKLEGRYSA